MKYHYNIINKTTNHIDHTSESIVVNDGFGTTELFTGYDSEMVAAFWARDLMSLFSLNKDEYDIKVIGVHFHIKRNEPLHSTEPVRKKYKRLNDDLIWD